MGLIKDIVKFAAESVGFKVSSVEDVVRNETRKALRSVLENLEIGGSVEVADLVLEISDYSDIRANVCLYGQRHGKKFSVNRTKNGYRITRK